MNKRQVLENTFKKSFDMTRFVEFTTEFFNGVQIVAPNKLLSDYWNWSEFSIFIEGYSQVANYVDPDKSKVSIFAVKLKKGKSVEKARSMQRNFVSKLLSFGNINGAIVAFYSDEDPRWRLSFVKLEVEFMKGKITTNITPAKRYSYLVGEKEPCHTAMNRLLPIFENEKFNPTLSQIEEAFSVEVVTKAFFEQYKQKYIDLKEFLEQNDSFANQSQRHNFTAEQFAKKLMGQIAFLYFLQKKGWMGVKAIPEYLNEKQYKDAFFLNSITRKVVPKVYMKIGEDKYQRQVSALNGLDENDEFALACGVARNAEPWGTGSRTYMRDLFDYASKRGNFFDEVLEPLFYEALNQKREASDYYCKLHCRIPFLNGGLFEPLENYDWNNNDFSIPNEMFSNKIEKGENADGILDIFDRYNFTINEDEPLEREVAVDPEMLGKIFENLLDVKDRKSKGAFYTPREIVHYMCQESLINYLVNEVNAPYDDVKQFILYGEILKDEDTSREVKDGVAIRQLSDSVFSKLYEIDKALASVRVADPAVGSGAFPMGMVSEICRARNNITAYMALQAKTSGEKYQLFNVTRNQYLIKKETMRNCIFAVDIEPSAVDITKLRLWLSLVVEQDIDDQDSKNPYPLPNLDCNIMCGNSLIDEFEGIKLFDDKILTGEASDNMMDLMMRDEVEGIFNKMFEAQRELFYANDHFKKQELKSAIRKYIDIMVDKQLEFASQEVKEHYEVAKDKTSTPFFLWKLNFAKVFKEKGGFDIVIGNPPYGEIIKDNKDYFVKRFKATEGKFEIYKTFIEFGLELINVKGVLSYITPDTWLKLNSFKKLRKMIYEKFSIALLSRSLYKVFGATVDTNIFIIKRGFREKIKIVNDNFIETDYIAQEGKDGYELFVEEKCDIIVKIAKNCISLGEISEIWQGLIAYEKKEQPRSWTSNIKETEYHKKFLYGRDISKYCIHWSGEYLKYGEWLHRARPSYIFFEPKILVQRIRNPKLSQRIIASFDEDGYINGTGLSNILIKNERYNILYVLALINSKVINYWFSYNYNDVNIKPEQLRNIPIALCSNQQNILSITNKIIDLKKENAKSNTIDLENQIDKLVYELYGLTEEEIAIVESK